MSYLIHGYPLWQWLAIAALFMLAGALVTAYPVWRLAERVLATPPGRHAATPTPVVYAEVTSPDLPRLDHEGWPVVEHWPDWDDDTLTRLRAWDDAGEWGKRLAVVDEPSGPDTVLLRADSRSLATLDALTVLDPDTAVFYEGLMLAGAG